MAVKEVRQENSSPMTISALEAYLRNQAARVEAALEELLPSATAYPPRLHEAMRYSTCGGGKRLRGILVLASAAAIREVPETVTLPVAVALECIHAYSLIHDDLPCMDNDDFRRGKPANHKVYGEAMALLAGDALLTQAFYLLSRDWSQEGGKWAKGADFLSPATRLQVLAEIAAAAGSSGMVGGQAVDLEWTGRDLSYETLRDLHARKTGALLRVAVRAGALLAGAGAEELAALTRYGEELGLTFQIVDDILDVIGEEEKLGKPRGSDARNAKTTYPSLFGLERARELAAEAAARAEAALAPLGERGATLRALSFYLLSRDH